MKILVTGANGYIGFALLRRLSAGHRDVMACSRVPISSCTRWIRSPDLNATADWRPCLEGIDVVIHVAGKAHDLNEQAHLAVHGFQSVNCDGTINLGLQALESGVRRFIFLSSIGVNGSHTIGAPFSEFSPALPVAEYGASKLRAEEGLKRLVEGREMDVVIIRPPLVYAGNAPGNFRRLLRLIAADVPLPLASVKNKRSLISLDNLTDFISLCVDHRAAANELFLVSDEMTVSTSEIVEYVAAGMGKKPRLFPMADSLLKAGARLLGKPGLYTQLCESLIIDARKAQSLLGWRPPVLPYDGLVKAGRDFMHGTAA
jgi:nucleoside-diphosphate-sugar epimerase